MQNETSVNEHSSFTKAQLSELAKRAAHLFPATALATGAIALANSNTSNEAKTATSPRFGPMKIRRDFDQLPLPIHQLAANCFLASTGTSFVHVDDAYLEQMTQEVQRARQAGHADSALDIWQSAIDQARAVLASDSVEQRISRSVDFAKEGVELLARVGVSLAVGRDISHQPPLPMKASATTLPGRCQ